MILVDKRISKFTKLKPYCHMSKEHGFAEICEWSNGEGFDVTVNSVSDEDAAVSGQASLNIWTVPHVVTQSRNVQRFSLTYGQWAALQVLVNYKTE